MMGILLVPEMSNSFCCCAGFSPHPKVSLKILFQLSRETKFPQNKVSRPKHEIEMPRKKIIENSSFSNLKCYKNTNFPLKLSKLQIFFRKKVYFIFRIKRKTDLETPHNPNGKNHEKISSKTRISMVKTGTFYRNLYVPFEKRKLFKSWDLQISWDL